MPSKRIRECVKAAQSLEKLLAHIGREEVVPAGFHPLWELVKQSGKSEAYVCRRLRSGIAAGTIEAQKFRCKTPGGFLRTMTHYRLKSSTR